MLKGRAVIGLLVLLSVATGYSKRLKRDLLDLADMFESTSGLDATDYIPYGNWCGYGGGGIAVDRIDSCCEAHDKCYESAVIEECRGEQIHLVQYSWSSVNETIVCDEQQSKCESAVCVCDKDVVECIVEHNHVYSEGNRYARYKKDS